MEAAGAMKMWETEKQVFHIFTAPWKTRRRKKRKRGSEFPTAPTAPTSGIFSIGIYWDLKKEELQRRECLTAGLVKAGSEYDVDCGPEAPMKSIEANKPVGLGSEESFSVWRSVSDAGRVDQSISGALDRQL